MEVGLPPAFVWPRQNGMRLRQSKPVIRNAFIEGQDKCFDLKAVHPLGHKKIRNDPDF
jgi:hypothetical protein